MGFRSPQAQISASGSSTASNLDLNELSIGWRTTGAATIADPTRLATIVTWLAAPISGATKHSLEPWVYWHARLMVAAWNVLLPLGMLVARFLKVPRRSAWPAQLDNKLWWRSHVATQCVGIAVMSIGVLMAIGNGHRAGAFARLHHWFGWCLVAIGWLQVVGGTARGTKGGLTGVTLRGDHYDMTRRRVLFEYLHKFGGWATIPLIVLTTGIGLSIADAPRWMAVVLALWWVGLSAGFVWLQRAGYCIDTYQAIWGADPVHPGNARRPIGWGVRRLGRRDGLLAARTQAGAPGPHQDPHG